MSKKLASLGIGCAASILGFGQLLREAFEPRARQVDAFGKTPLVAVGRRKTPAQLYVLDPQGAAQRRDLCDFAFQRV